MKIMTHTLQKHKIEHRYYIRYIYIYNIWRRGGWEGRKGELFSSRYELFTQIIKHSQRQTKLM